MSDESWYDPSMTALLIRTEKSISRVLKIWPHFMSHEPHLTELQFKKIRYQTIMYVVFPWIPCGLLYVKWYVTTTLKSQIFQTEILGNADFSTQPRKSEVKGA